MIDFIERDPPDIIPANLLPAALPEIMGTDLGDTGMRHGQLTVSYRAEDGQLRWTTAPPPHDSSQVFGSLGDALTDYDNKTLLHLGPRIGPQRSSGSIIVPTTEDEPFIPDIWTDVGVIDAGIAFWNPAFHPKEIEAASYFQSAGALTVTTSGGVAHDQLTADEISNAIASGELKALETLRSKFPSSVFGEAAPRPLYGSNRLSHGTAMVDLILSEAPQFARLHTLELPVPVVRDLTGGQMAGVMDAALCAVVLQAAEAPDRENPLKRMTVLMAFGFTGGPQDGTAELLAVLHQTLDDFKNKKIDVELVLPVGNQLQDQIHATLKPGNSVGWRVLPDDYSVNTLESIQANNSAPLDIQAPDGSRISLPAPKASGGLWTMRLNNKPIGAVWMKALTGNKVRTRVSLAPTATLTSGASTAPFGLWRLHSPFADAKLWILRDETGYEADPHQPFRASWFEDKLYQRTDALGLPALVDHVPAPGAPRSSIRRDGTASVLASSQHSQITVVTAKSGPQVMAHYSGMLSHGVVPIHAVDIMGGRAQPAPIGVVTKGPLGRRAVLGHGGPQRYWAAGTSLAAALYVGKSV